MCVCIHLQLPLPQIRNFHKRKKYKNKEKRIPLNSQRHCQTKYSTMALPLRALLPSLLLLLLLLLSHDVHANGPARNAPHAGLRKVGKPRFKPGPWRSAKATFYGSPDGYLTGGACGYGALHKQVYGAQTTAISPGLFNGGQGCGACFEIKCGGAPGSCRAGKGSLMVTATNLCPPGSTGGWCDPPREHFDLTQPAFLQIAEHKAGIVPVQYRRVPCKRQGGIRFTITGNPYFNLVFIWNIGGAGDVASVHVKGDRKVPWTPLKRNWGMNWETDAKLVGESLTFRVRSSDGRSSTSWHVAPKKWQFGQTFEGKNFR